jgi:hypothetical protein
MPDISYAFSNAVGGPTLHKNIEPLVSDLEALRDARAKIKSALVTSIEEYTQKRENGGRKITPKFWIQGSIAYKTVNAPAHNPPQEVDCDYGVYLPIQFHQKLPPAAAAKAYFNLVEETLRGLTRREQNWEIDFSKTTCVRVSLGKRTHIDLPLYAVPEEGYQRLITEAAKRLDSSMMKIAAASVNENKWLYDLDEVHLAMRDGSWLPSDPIKIREWFENQVAIHRNDLVRLCKYLKAWRDWQWTEKGPTSICLMAGAVANYNGSLNSDHERLESAVESLLVQFRSGTISNPDGGGENLLERLGNDGIKIAIQRLERFHLQVAGARAAGTPLRTSHEMMRQEFGPRFPEYYEDKSTSIRNLVSSAPAQVTSSPRIPSKSTSGQC